MKIFKTTKCYLSAIPMNTEYTVCVEPQDKQLISEIYELCGVKNGSIQHEVMIEVDDTDNRFNRPSLHMAVYYTNAETNEPDVYVVSRTSVLESKRYAVAQKILTLLKEYLLPI